MKNNYTYNNIEFISQIDVVWAMFFDLANIPYDYKPASVALPDGEYCADFFLPWFNSYVSVDDNTFGMTTTKDFIKMEAAFDKLGDKFILRFSGYPYRCNMYTYTVEHRKDKEDNKHWTDVAFLRGTWGQNLHGEGIIWEGGKNTVYLGACRYGVTKNDFFSTADNEHFGLAMWDGDDLSYRWDFKQTKEYTLVLKWMVSAGMIPDRDDLYYSGLW